MLECPAILHYAAMWGTSYWRPLKEVTILSLYFQIPFQTASKRIEGNRRWTSAMIAPGSPEEGVAVASAARVLGPALPEEPEEEDEEEEGGRVGPPEEGDSNPAEEEGEAGGPPRGSWAEAAARSSLR